MARAVRFFLDAEGQARQSGRYDRRPRQTWSEVIDAACRIFHFTAEEQQRFLCERSATIVCTPESFVEWQIWRNSQGFINRWRGMGVRFVDQPDFPKRLVLVERL